MFLNMLILIASALVRDHYLMEIVTNDAATVNTIT